MEGSEVFEGFGGKFVLLVEVGGDDEEAVFIESFEGLIEDLGPHRFVVPIVLVTKEGDVGGSDFGEIEESVAAMGDKIGRGVLFFGLLQFGFPPGVGLVDLGGTNIEALEVGRFRFLGEKLGEDTGFVATAAGKIEQGNVVFFQEMRVEKITKIRFQRLEIGLEEFGERSVSHEKRLI